MDKLLISNIHRPVEPQGGYSNKDIPEEIRETKEIVTKNDTLGDTKTFDMVTKWRRIGYKSDRKISTVTAKLGVVWEHGDLGEKMVPDPYAGI